MKRMPEPIRKAAERAVERHMSRPVTPEMAVLREADGWSIKSPYEGKDGDRWIALLFEGFGSRSQKTVQTFLDQLADLCPTRFDEDAQIWAPDDQQFAAAVQIVRSLKPRNEAEACLAAQMVAVHFATMRVGNHIGRMSWPDERTAATLSRLARTFTMQMDAMRKVKGKGGTTRQKITVKHERHIHQHQHVHIAGGAGDFGEQAHTAMGSRTGENVRSPALPCPDADRRVVPLRSGEGEACLPHARRRARVGRTEG
jgi:hypothetical protein